MNRKYSFLIPLLAVLFCFSCVTNRELVYVQSMKKNGQQPDAFQIESELHYLIEPGDELFIRVTSFDQTTNFFNPMGREYYAMTDVTLVSYTVNEAGLVQLPYIGELQIINKTLEEAAQLIEENLRGLLNQPSVTIKLVNKKVTVLGEVNAPGIYTFYDKRINIFQALGYARDINRYGNRKNVLIIREENNVVTKTYLNLLDEDIFNSYYFIIKPNDVIYVEPLKKQVWGIREFPYNLVFSTITATLLILNYFR